MVAIVLSFLVLAAGAGVGRSLIGATAKGVGDVHSDMRGVDNGPDGAPGPGGGSGADSSASGIEKYRGPDWIAAENNTPGSSGWIIPDDPKMWERIRGYASSTSVNHGEAFTLFVSTGAPTWKADAYRIGYYAGTGGRLIWSSDDRSGVRQGDAVVDRATNMAEARWGPSIEVDTGPGWPPGMYLIRLTSSDGGASFVPIVVRDDDSQAPILAQSSVTTWQAYNGWGGANLYTGQARKPSSRAKVVSFDRPYGGNGSGEFFGREFEFAYWAEREGLDVTYWTDIDLNDRPELALNHKVVVSLGHDEYYSTNMRTGLERARDHGVNLAFLGANAIYRKIRLEDSPVGRSRREVNYRVARSDPAYGRQDDQVTVSWREVPSNNPESALLGNYYECNPVKADWVVGDASAWMFEGTGFRDGDKVPGMVGNEYDRVTPEAPTPKNIQVIAHSPVTCRKVDSFADSTYYTADSGAGVFSIGTFWLIPRLKTECPAVAAGAVPDNVDCKIQRLTRNLLRVFAQGPAGREHPSVNNLDRFGIKPGYLAHGRPQPDSNVDSAATSSTTPPNTAPATTTRTAPTTTSTRPVTTTTTPRTTTTTRPPASSTTSPSTPGTGP